MKKGILFAILAAALYALNSPCSKMLLDGISPNMMAALLYWGAGIGVGILRMATHKNSKEAPLTKGDLPYVIGMIVLDIAAPICLMQGLARTTSASASLLNNFEIVATAIIALVLFHEKVGKYLWIGIAFVVASSVLLSVDTLEGVQFSGGSLLVLLASTCWGLENNCTRRLSDKDPMQIVLLKGIFSGTGAFLVALLSGEALPQLSMVLPALLLGFVAYGLSIYFYIYAQRTLGAAKTGAWYAIAPFIGVALSFVFFGAIPNILFYPALLLMCIGTIFVVKDGQ